MGTARLWEGSAWIAALILMAVCILLLAWLLPRTRRRWAKCLIVVAVAFAGLCAFQPLWFRVARSETRGTWCCLVCARMEYQHRWRSFVLERRPSLDPEAPEAAAYAAWFSHAIGGEHEHDWRPRGCMAVGADTIACSLRGPVALNLLRSLPALPDQDLARRMARRITEASRDERTRLTVCFETIAEDAGPFALIAAGEPMTRAEFAEAHEEWLAEHPEWR